MNADLTSREGARLRLMERLKRVARNVLDVAQDPYYTLYAPPGEAERISAAVTHLRAELARLDAAAFQQSLGLDSDHRGSRA